MIQWCLNSLLKVSVSRPAALTMNFSASVTNVKLCNCGIPVTYHSLEPILHCRSLLPDTIFIIYILLRVMESTLYVLHSRNSIHVVTMKFLE